MNERLFCVDTDVHHSIPNKAALYPYLPAFHRERLREFGCSTGNNPYYNNGGVRGRRADSFSPDAADAGGNVDLLRSQLLDACDVDVAVLTGSSAYEAACMPDVDYGSAICAAFNDYSLEHWLAKEARLRCALAINPQDPAAAAREIRRLGARPGVVGVMMPTGAPKPYGNRFYDPIYEACLEHGLTPMLHLGTEGIGLAGAPTAAGWPSYYIESRLARPGSYSAHLGSFIFEGTFSKFPSLKVVLVECGISWIPAFLWRADADWKGLRYQTPWVQKLPSEYVADHVRFNTQPLDEPPTDEDLERIIRWMHGERTLMFGSDYPHWDFDDPRRTLAFLPRGLRERIHALNALDAFPRLRDFAAAVADRNTVSGRTPASA